MLAVPYFEKRLYELPDDQVTAERILQLADDVERDVELGPSPRPLLSVPHPLSDESSAYYHGYVLAEMAVRRSLRSSPAGAKTSRRSSTTPAWERRSSSTGSRGTPSLTSTW